MSNVINDSFAFGNVALIANTRVSGVRVTSTVTRCFLALFSVFETLRTRREKVTSQIIVQFVQGFDSGTGFVGIGRILPRTSAHCGIFVHIEHREFCVRMHECLRTLSEVVRDAHANSCVRHRQRTVRASFPIAQQGRLATASECEKLV
jgi:hypothetical protein